MKSRLAELITGAVVLAIAVIFLGYAVAHSGRSTGTGYPLNARFDRIDGLTIGADVRLAGVKIGTIDAARIDAQTFQAIVTISVRNDIKLPRDTSAEITSDGLLGGKFLSLVPGGDDKVLAPGGTIAITQSAVSLEQLLGKFIFSVSDMATSLKQPAGGAAPATAPAPGK